MNKKDIKKDFIRRAIYLKEAILDYSMDDDEFHEVYGYSKEESREALG